MIRDALLSSDGKYRFKLYRQWVVPADKTICWIMLNPSSADAEIDDPTIRKCIRFSEIWGYHAMWVGNLNPYRTSDPLKIPKDESLTPIVNHGSAWQNRGCIWQIMDASDKIVVAWGTHGYNYVPPWIAEDRVIYCLGKTKFGYPKHPLYLKLDTELEVFGFSSEEIGLVGKEEQ